MKGMKRRIYSNSCRFALICCGLGRLDDALAYLERTLHEHTTMLPFWLVDPRFHPIRPMDRFQSLLRNMRLI